MLSSTWLNTAGYKTSRRVAEQLVVCVQIFCEERQNFAFSWFDIKDLDETKLSHLYVVVHHERRSWGGKWYGNAFPSAQDFLVISPQR